MKLDELHRKLMSLGISEDQYYLHGLYGSKDDNDKIALTIKRGKNVIEYEVYYRERGEKQVMRVFTNETEACQYIYKKCKESIEIEKKILETGSINE